MTTLETRRYAQIPGVAMARAEAIPVASGELRIVPFEEWLTFVGRDVRRSESRYTRLAPVFYVDSSLLELDETGELVLDLFELPLVTRRLQLVLMLLSGWPLPDPAQSTGYVLLPEEGSRFRVPGARDIEWMVYPATETPLVIDGSMPIADVMSEIERLDAAGQGTELARLFDVFPLVFDGQLSHAEQLVFSMLLCGPGDLIAPHHTTIVGRSSTGWNARRPPDRSASRFLAVTFGEDHPVSDTGRNLHGLGGEMYGITPERALIVDEMVHVVRRIEARAETDETVASVLSVGHNFSQSRSFILAPRVRFVALFAAIEILLGEFGPVGERPGLGHLLATFHVPAEEREQVGDRLEDELRSVRNQTIHGGVPAEDLIRFLDGLIPLVQPLVRAAYILALDDDRGEAAHQAIRGRVSAHATRVLRSLLGAAYRGSSEADEALAGVGLRAASETGG